MYCATSSPNSFPRRCVQGTAPRNYVASVHLHVRIFFSELPAQMMTAVQDRLSAALRRQRYTSRPRLFIATVRHHAQSCSPTTSSHPPDYSAQAMRTSMNMPWGALPD
eukprot:CAMPEP_0177775670 /NCGR_PEP_ID=MMETSP0491_2-20121128/14251_1 /TAXON_ID=63592 /ORGANISM="Tetraselmis chuii, Strain PLY429" /LENGTH=107 /DNA_ID=CAMNT_0019294305 /DNA_START=156 /DNA_END=479 /DNA_ORIENTATION=+